MNSFVTNTSLSSTLSSYVTNTSLTSSLSNYASLNNHMFGGSNLYFWTTSKGGWNIGYSLSSFGISLNNIIQALSIINTGLITIPQGISGYSTTSQVNTLITNALSSYTATVNLSSNYVSNSSLSNYVTHSALSNYSTTSQTNNLISSSIACNQKYNE